MNQNGEMEMSNNTTYEGIQMANTTESIEAMPETSDKGNNILISNFDRYHEHGHELEAVVYITERYSFTPVSGGYHETVLAQGDRERVREAVTRALDYARSHTLQVQVNNPHVLEDIAAGRYDLTGLTVVDYIGRPIAREV